MPDGELSLPTMTSDCSRLRKCAGASKPSLRSHTCTMQQQPPVDRLHFDIAPTGSMRDICLPTLHHWNLNQDLQTIYDDKHIAHSAQVAAHRSNEVIPSIEQQQGLPSSCSFGSFIINNTLHACDATTTDACTAHRARAHPHGSL